MKIESLHIYPIKSCRGIDVKEIEVGEFGPKWDREWMFVSPNGDFITQRTHPKLALVRPKLGAGRLIVEVGGDEFQLSDTQDSEDPSIQSLQVRVFKSSILAQRVLNPRLEAAVSDLLSLSVHLVRFGSRSARRVKSEGVLSNYSLRFADGYPWLLTTIESLECLNQDLKENAITPVPMNRFRPNIVVRGLEAFAEEGLSSFSLSGIEFEAVKGCSRCPMITVDQLLGSKTGHEPLKRMATTRLRDGQVYFGMNLVSKNAGVLKY